MISGRTGRLSPRAALRVAARGVPWVAVLVLAGCGDDGATGPDAQPADVCAVADGTGVSFDPADRQCERLSSYRFFTGALADQTPNQGVVPYDVTTPLYADYTVKHRFLWLPEGTSMDYHEREAFAFPVGGVLIKTFAYLADRRQPDGERTLLETRLLYRKASGWDVATYVWNAEQTEAVREVAGESVASQWIHDDGELRQLDYSVPNKNQCKNCHEEIDDEIGPLGPKARYLNRELDYPGGAENQLQHLADRGYLAGLPADLADVPVAPTWDDPDSGTLEERARAWLDINCAHCHNPRGAARTSGLDLSFDQTDPYEYGVCKGPVAAGGGSGGRQYNIVPGLPDESILIYRLESDALDERMPEVGRQLMDEEGVALIRSWIASLTGDCAVMSRARDPSPSGRWPGR